MDILKGLGKKKQKPSGKKLAEDDRKSGSKIESALTKAKTYAAGIDENYAEQTENFYRRIRSAPTISSYDTSKLDDLLAQVIGIFTDAMKSGHDEVVKDGLTIIRTGFGLRTELQPHERGEAEKHQKEKEEKLEQWKNYLVNVQAHAENLDELDRLEKDVDEKRTDLTEQYQRLVEEIKGKPAWEKLKTFRPQKDSLTEEAKELGIRLGKYRRSADLYIVAVNEKTKAAALVGSEESGITAIRDRLNSNLQILPDMSEELEKLNRQAAAEARELQDSIRKIDTAITNMRIVSEEQEKFIAENIANDTRFFENQMEKTQQMAKEREAALKREQESVNQEAREELLNA